MTGCHRAAAGAARDDASSGSPLVVRADTVGLLLSWIDEKGDFHVEQKASDVPLVGRDAGYALIRLNSGEVRRVRLECKATVGAVSAYART